VVAAALTAYLTFIAVRDLVTSWELTSLPGVTIKEPPPTPEGGMGLVTDPSVPLQPVGGPTPEPWDGAERVTLLVMGLDYRDWESGDGPPRTDTMILLTLDPVNRTAGMLSIPRDLWVNIPGFDYGKINTAYQLGEAFQLPGGGPGLAMQTVEELLGVPIDFYAQIDFSAFVRFIDEIDGVKIDVPEEITVDPLGDNNLKTLKPGRQTLPGDLALAYARARKTEGGDFDRAQRQQQVILAIRDRIINFDMLPTLIRKSGVLYNELSSGIHTNLTLEQTIKLAWMAVQIPEDQIRRGIIGAEQVNFQTSPEGLDILKPLPNEVRKLRDEIFTDTGPASPAAADMDPLESMQAENARVAVLNGTYTPGLAARTTEYLKSQGVNVTETGNAQSNVTYTEITFYTGKPYTVAYLVDLMGINQYRIHHLFDPANSVDVSVVLGEDWAGNNPMP
jgi:LCP family protein required for cell wall assembly